MDHPKELTILSLCAGYGGLELGLSRALENPLHVVAVEIEAFALANLETKAAQGLLAIDALWSDLRTFPAERFRGCFDIVTGGYPCQPFSLAGKRQGEEDPRHLWPDIERIVRAVEPVWCFFENVPGHLSLGFPGVYRSLRSLGYSVEAGLFTAAECGAPHKRQRLFILARRIQCYKRLHENCGGYDDANAGVSTEERDATLQSVQDIAYVAHRQSTGDANGKECGRRTFTNKCRATVSDAQCSKAKGVGQFRNDVPGEVLSDTSRSELPGRESQRGYDGPQLTPPSGIRDLWPAGPGQPQYEWEEPRVVVGNSSAERCERSNLQLRESGGGKRIQHRNSPVRSGKRGEVEHTTRLHGPAAERQLRRGRGIRQAGEAGNISNAERTEWRTAKESVSQGAGKEEPGTERTVAGQAQPPLGESVDGSARGVVRSRVDQLRLLGNGVVPAQAELAFRTLWQRVKNASAPAAFEWGSKDRS